jgi:hypothetical protein
MVRCFKNETEIQISVIKIQVIDVWFIIPSITPITANTVAKIINK